MAIDMNKLKIVIQRELDIAYEDSRYNDDINYYIDKNVRIIYRLPIMEFCGDPKNIEYPIQHLDGKKLSSSRDTDFFRIYSLIFNLNDGNADSPGSINYKIDDIPPGNFCYTSGNLTVKGVTFNDKIVLHYTINNSRGFTNLSLRITGLTGDISYFPEELEILLKAAVLRDLNLYVLKNPQNAEVYAHEYNEEYARLSAFVFHLYPRKIKPPKNMLGRYRCCD